MSRSASPERRYDRDMVPPDAARVLDATVTDDGSAVIPAEELRGLGLVPGEHLTVRIARAAGRESARGRLSSWPDLSPEAFAKASESAIDDVGT